MRFKILMHEAFPGEMRMLLHRIELKSFGDIAQIKSTSRYRKGQLK